MTAIFNVRFEPGSGQDGRGGGLAGGGAGEVEANLWSGASQYAEVGEQPHIHIQGSGQDGGSGGLAGGAGEAQMDRSILTR